MKGYLKKIICLLIILMSLLIAGCYYYTPTGDVIEEGFKARRSEIVGAVRSKVNTFDIDDVTLDFYIGGDTINENRENAILLYFADRFGRPSSPKPDEYKTTDGYYFVGEIDAKTFNNGPFDVSIRYGYIGNNFYFRFLRRLTIPQELFGSDEGHIEFLVASLPTIDEETKEYIHETVWICDSIALDYRKLDNGKIMISTIN